MKAAYRTFQAAKSRIEEEKRTQKSNYETSLDNEQYKLFCNSCEKLISHREWEKGHAGHQVTPISVERIKKVIALKTKTEMRDRMLLEVRQKLNELLTTPIAENLENHSLISVNENILNLLPETDFESLCSDISAEIECDLTKTKSLHDTFARFQSGLKSYLNIMEDLTSTLNSKQVNFYQMHGLKDSTEDAFLKATLTNLNHSKEIERIATFCLHRFGGVQNPSRLAIKILTSIFDWVKLHIEVVGLYKIAEEILGKVFALYKRGAFQNCSDVSLIKNGCYVLIDVCENKQVLKVFKLSEGREFVEKESAKTVFEVTGEQFTMTGDNDYLLLVKSEETTEILVFMDDLLPPRRFRMSSRIRDLKLVGNHFVASIQRGDMTESFRVHKWKESGQLLASWPSFEFTLNDIIFSDFAMLQMDNSTFLAKMNSSEKGRIDIYRTDLDRKSDAKSLLKPMVRINQQCENVALFTSLWGGRLAILPKESQPSNDTELKILYFSN